MIRTYSELILVSSFEERFYYLRMRSVIGEVTFGFDRWINQRFYKSLEWKRTRNFVISRDSACDLGVSGREIPKFLVVHHMNPITIKDIEKNSDLVFNPEYLITTSMDTHRAIHYGAELLFDKPVLERRAGDTCPWKVS